MAGVPEKVIFWSVTVCKNYVVYQSYENPMQYLIPRLMLHVLYLRNKSWKPECPLSFNMGWRILVFYPEPASMNYFDSDMSNSTHTIVHFVYFDWKAVIYIYVCGQCSTQFMLPNSSRR